MKLIRVGINGFGRIGRAIAKNISKNKNIKITTINEKDPDIQNMAYLWKYDSLYGRASEKIVANGSYLYIENKKIFVSSESSIANVDWKKNKVDVIIDASGVKSNADLAKNLVHDKKCSKVIITNSFDEADATIVFSVNEFNYNRNQHHVISSSICDTNGVAPVLKMIYSKWGIKSAFITTLHPWLSYQNLLDGSVSSIASPGHTWTDYSLGRASVMNLIPKSTTICSSLSQIFPWIHDRVKAMSFRVPTHVVAAADITINTEKAISVAEVHNSFSVLEKKYPNVCKLEKDLCVSSDFQKISQSCVVDGNRTQVVGKNMLKLVVWYDNEWGYANRVVDLINIL